jgi:nitroreductase
MLKELEALLEAFRRGPSSRNAQPWRIIIANDRAVHDAGQEAGMATTMERCQAHGFAVPHSRVVGGGVERARAAPPMDGSIPSGGWQCLL